MEPLGFDDPLELLFRRVPPNHAPEGRLKLESVFRWPSDRDEAGMSVDREAVTGPDPRAYWPIERRETHGVASLPVGSLPMDVDEDGCTFRLRHTPEPENPAHSDVLVAQNGDEIARPGLTHKKATLRFRAVMKTLCDEGVLRFEPPTGLLSDESGR